MGIDQKTKKIIVLFSLIFCFSFVFAEEITTIVINNARRTEYKKSEETGNDSIFLDGNVELSIKKNDDATVVRADSVVYDRKTEMLYAEGTVEIIQKKSSGGEDKTSASSVLLNTKTMEGVFDGARVVMGNTDAFSLPSDSVLVVFSEIFGKTNNNVISFKNSRLTFCDEEDPHWQIKASRTWLLPGGEFAFLNALLYVGPVPVMYFPAFYYPKDELVFNPVFSYTNRKGNSINNTLYLFGRKPLPESSTSDSSSSTESSATQAVESLRNFLRHSTLKEQKLEGLMLRNLDEDYKGDTTNYIKLMVDWYSKLGFMAGFDMNFLPKNSFFNKLNFGASLAFSNTIFSSGNNFSIYASGTGKRYKDESNFLGLKLPFRYSANFTFEMSKPFTVKLSFPLYSDPFYSYDFLTSRSEHMDWISYFLENAMWASDEDETVTEISSFTWKLDTSFTPTLPQIVKPYINSLSISTSSFVNFSSVTTKWESDAPTDGWTTYTPQRKFYYPSQITPVNLRVSVSGNVFQYPFIKASSNKKINYLIDLNKPDELKSVSQLEKEAATETQNEVEASSVLAEENIESEYYTMVLTELAFTNPSINKVSGISYNLGYSINANFNTQMSYSSESFAQSDDFDWKTIRSYMYSFSLPISLNSSFKYADGLFSLSNSLTYTPHIQDHPFVLIDAPGGYTESSANALKLADFNAKRQDIANSNSIGFYPFKFLPYISESGITWNTNFKLLRLKFLGDIDNPEWDTLPLDFKDAESVTTNNVNFILASSEMDGLFKQSLTFSIVMPPQLKQYTANLNLKFPFVSFSLAGGISQKEKDSSVFTKNPLQQSLSVSLFNSSLIFSESFNYNLEDNNPDSLKLSASWKGITASYVMSYTKGADFDDNQGWILREDKEFLPYSASLTIAPTLPTFKTWFKRITFKPGINTNVVVDLIRPTNSYLLFSPSISFTINEFLTFTFSSTSRNSVLYRYVQSTLGHSGRIPGEENFFIDLFNSFRFDDETLRKGSGFKLKSLNFEITHNLHDWDFKMLFKMEPRLITEKGKTQYSFDPYITIGVVWRPIEAIKTQIVDDYGTWKLE